MAGNIPYIGSKISLITTSDIRYEGILFTLNREESTIAVQNVRSFGTEGRRTPEVPMSNEIYDFIIFRGKDLKDLTVLQGAPERQSAASTHSPASMGGGGSYGGHGNEYLDSHSLGQTGMSQSPYDSGSGGYSHQSQGCSGQLSSGVDGSGLGQRGLHSTSALGSSAGVGAYQRPSAASAAPTRNGYGGGNHMGNDVGGLSDGYLSSSASRPPSSAPDKNSYGQAPSALGRQHYSDGPQGHPPAYMPDPGRGAGMYEEGNGLGSSRGLLDEGKGGPRPPGATSSAQTAGKMTDGQDRGSGSFGMQGAMDGKGAAAAGSAPGMASSLADPKGKGRGKAGAQKKPLVEVLRFHKRAEELIVKTMKSQSSASLQPQELRAMSQGNLAVYHFYLDFVNYCCPSSALSDEQQWEGLSKALKKHFEKDFGSGPGQNQKAQQQQQRPNNTLADFITIEPSKNAKKNAKVQPGGGQPSTKPVPPKGKGRGLGKDKKDDEFDGPGGFEDSSSGAASTWVCPRCTLRNESILMECAACGTPKQAAALWAEFPPLGS